ncbi:MAG: C4-dicarboxylate TRAP transporter substrate-binding protein [Syntrophaceae bacterium]|nr:C4-dicarboxylate TRAP transporter substrate-binding protein [Syntrophaceae bacterium]
MKKWRRLSTLIATIGLLTVTVGLPFVSSPHDAAAADPKAIKLRYGNYAPKGAIDEPALWFADEVSKRTGVKIELEAYYAGTLAKPPDCLDAIGKGVYHFGWISPVFTPAKIPLAIIPNSLPLVVPTLYTGLKAADEVVRTYPPAAAEYEKNNVKCLFHTGVWHYNLISKKPVKSLEDIKGLKVRTFGYLSKAWDELGGVPVTIPISQAYDALQKGVIDGVLTQPYSMWKSTRLCEVAKSFTRMDLGCLPTPVIMNLDTWKKLPEKVQKEMLNVANEMPLVAEQIISKIEFDAIEGMKKEGIAMYEVGAADKARMKEVAKSITKIVVEDLTSKGIDRAKEVTDIYLKAIQKYEK